MYSIYGNSCDSESNHIRPYPLSKLPQKENIRNHKKSYFVWCIYGHTHSLAPGAQLCIFSPSQVQPSLSLVLQPAVVRSNALVYACDRRKGVNSNTGLQVKGNTFVNNPPLDPRLICRCKFQKNR